jgi:hypothetical protein
LASVRLTHRLSVLLAALALAVAGCGEEVDSSSSGNQGQPGGEREAFPAADSSQGALADSVPLNDAAIVENSLDRIENLCREIVPPEDAQQNVDQAVRQLVDMYRQYGPEIFFESGDVDTRKPMSEVLDDAARNLRACGEPEAATELQRQTQPS